MIYLFPYYFGDFDQWQKLGIDMLKQAYQKTKDPMLKMIYLGCDVTRDLKGYYDACIEAKPLVAERFTGNGVYNHYFVQVLNRKNSSFKEFKKSYSKKKQKLNILKHIVARIMKLGNLTQNNP